MNVQDTTVTGTVLADMAFRDFLCACYHVTPPKLQKIATATISPSLYVTELVVVTEALSSKVATKCTTSSSSSLDNPFPPIVFVANP